jgi:hypothetical protein
MTMTMTRITMSAVYDRSMRGQWDSPPVALLEQPLLNGRTAGTAEQSNGQPAIRQ